MCVNLACSAHVALPLACTQAKWGRLIDGCDETPTEQKCSARPTVSSLDKQTASLVSPPTVCAKPARLKTYRFQQESNISIDLSANESPSVSMISMEEQLPWKSPHSQSTHGAKFIFCLLRLCHVALPTIQREGSAKGLAGQSVTLSQFRASSTLKGALVLTLAPFEVSNGWDGTFQHLLCSSHFSSSSTLPSFLSIHATGSHTECESRSGRRGKNRRNVCGETSRNVASVQAGLKPDPRGTGRSGPLCTPRPRKTTDEECFRVWTC